MVAWHIFDKEFGKNDDIKWKMTLDFKNLLDQNNS